MKRLLAYLLIVFGLGATIYSSANANAWLVLEGINAAFQGGKIATEKIKDKIGNFKSKKKSKKNQKRNIEYQNYLAAIDNCADLQGVVDGWDHRNVCLWAAKQWNINASNPPYLMSKAWAQNKEGDFAWEFGTSSASAIRKAIKKCNKVSKKNKSSCEVKSVNEYNILISQTNDPRLIKRLGGDTKVAKKKTHKKKKLKIAKIENNSVKDPEKSMGHRADLPYYCATADFTQLFSQGRYCNQKMYYTAHTKKYEPIIKLNKEIFYQMKNVKRKVVSELERKKEITGKDQSLLFYDLLYAKRKVIYDNLKHQLKSETKVAKAEEPKKKVKVVKKEEKKKQTKKVVKKQEASQEEFEPKKTNQDNEPPVIKISNSFTVNDANYEISGRVSDQSKRIFIEVDGQTIQAKKGKFTIKRFSPIDEQIEIVAIDKWGNKSKPQIVDIIIDTKVTLVADNIEPLNPNKIRSRSNKSKVALIIGIEDYKQTPAASFANLDAKFFYEYARKGFGVSKNNIKILVDEDANLISSLGALKKWLPGKIKAEETELIVFFAGHGLASNNGEELYLLPQDSDPDLLERTALSRNELFKEIIDLNPKSVTMFFDTCFSGISRDEKTLLASARPVRIVANEEEGIPDNFTIFSASRLDQISSGLKEVNHGIFSYYLMKGMEGNADANKDKNITNGELLAYMDENVSQKASELGRQQNPSLAGDPDKILMSYR